MKSQRVNCWALFRNVSLGQEWQAEFVLPVWSHGVPPNLQLVFWLNLAENTWAWDRRKYCARGRGMTAFIGQDVFWVPVSYLYHTPWAVALCMMIGWHFLLSHSLLVPCVNHSFSPFKLLCRVFCRMGKWGKGFSLSHPVGTSCILQALGRGSWKSTWRCWPL